MFSIIRHECGGRAHLVDGTMKLGWNLYCCNRCGAVFYKWITKAMLETKAN